MGPLNYAGSGVDISRGDAFASFIAKYPSPAVSPSIGGFSGGITFDPTRYREPVLLSTTDGVGTKILVAKKLGRYDTIGIDLVAMSVNDLIVCGAEPMTFLDYIACGRVDEAVLQEVIKGVIRGCEIAECKLSGGETAEMPDLYRPDDFDLAGFCVGIVDRSSMLPKLSEMKAGDVIFGLPSNGVHSNGLSLARKALPENDSDAWNQLLTPTRIYVQELKKLLSGGFILAGAHITGGGLEANFARVIPKELRARFSWSWTVPDIFDRIRRSGAIETEEMRRVFNMGVGVALVVRREHADTVLSDAGRYGIEILEIGELADG